MEPVWDPATFPLGAVAVLANPVDLGSQVESDEHLSDVPLDRAPPRWHGSGIEIARATRSWIQYGTVAFAVICIVIGAVEALFGR